MTVQLAEQPVLRAFRAVLKATFSLPGPRGDSVPEDRPRSELLRREMALAGDLLIDALGLEQEFNNVDLARADDEALGRWRACRAAVERMADDYASAMARWREAVLEDCLPGNIVMEHISDHDLERYHLGMVADEAELAPLEEHLLVCPDCAQRAEESAAYVDTIRSAIIAGDFDLD